jgi:ribosomal-protein-alanine N-acetyltransferase
MTRFVLETERVLLRELTPGDVDAFAEILGDPETMRFYPHPYSREETAEAIERARRSYREHDFGKWALILKETGELIGYCGLTLQDVDGEQLVEVGYVLRKTHWRKGLASEAALVCRDHAFRALGVDRVIALVRVENEPSAGVARKLGMKVWKRTQRAGFDHFVFSIHRSSLE